jgi:hypothetical protein
VPPNFSAAFISKIFYPDLYKEDRLYLVNHGQCYDWAMYAWHLFPMVNLWSTYNHAWVQVLDKHFDSETNLGRKNPRTLPCNKECGYNGARPIFDVDAFKDHWNNHGGRDDYHWEKLIDNIMDKGLTTVR